MSGKKFQRRTNQPMKLFFTIFIMIACGLSVLAADEEPEAAGEVW
jgi:hypothetical protein